MTDEEKATVLWAQANGIKRFKVDIDAYEVEFWSPHEQIREPVDIDAMLSAPVTDEELLGYDAPDHLKDPDDDEQR